MNHLSQELQDQMEDQGDAIQKLCLFCTQEATLKRPLHEIQKLSLIDEVKQKALAINETNSKKCLTN